MRPIGAYSLRVGDLVYKELESYAAALDAVTDAIDDAIRECFVTTAQEEGLENYERIVGAPRSELDLNTRREMLITLFGIGANDFTREGVERYFSSIGFECDITEDPEHYELMIVPRGTYTAAQRELINACAESFLPCHLTFTIEFRTADWDRYDAFNKTFNEWDEMELTWNELDKYEGDTI